MARTLVGIAAILSGVVAAVAAQAPAQTPAATSAASQAKVGQTVTYVGCVKRTLGANNFRLQEAVDIKATRASSKEILRLLFPEKMLDELVELINHKVEVTGTVGPPVKLLNAMDEFNSLKVTSLKMVSETCP